jgi:hypothetical protein
MTKQEFINKVLFIMNEAAMTDKEGTQFIGADTAQVDRQIEGSYVDAWRRCAKLLPRSWFKNKSFRNAGIVTNKDDGTGYVVLPDDFYLLGIFRMAGWQKPVYEASVENDRVAAIQTNEYTRGSEIRPVCTISQKDINGEIKHVLAYYSLKKGLKEHEIAEAIYVPVVRPLKELAQTDDIELSEQVIEPVAYITASTVFTMHQKDEIAQSLIARAIEMSPGLQSLKSGVVTYKQ